MGGGAIPVEGGAAGGPPDHPSSKIADNTTIDSEMINKAINLAQNLNLNLPLNKLDSADALKGKRAAGFTQGGVFGPVPSRTEVERAMRDLRGFAHGVSQSKMEDNLFQQMTFDPRILQSPGYKRIRDAYQMMQSDVAVQRMVASISSDKAVWDAIMHSKALQDLEGFIYSAKLERPQTRINIDNMDEEVRASRTDPVQDRPQVSTEKPDLTLLILKWILDMTTSKCVDLIEKFVLLMIDIFRPEDKEKATSELTDLVEEKVRSSILLSVLILFIVVVTRSYGG